MPKKGERRSHCPISYMLDILGDKWTLLVIRDILLMGKRTYGEFASSDEKIATNILADRLALLEEEGIIAKETDPVKKSRFIYSITKKGVDLLPVIIEMVRWSATYDKDTKVPKQVADKVINERDAFMQEILDALDRDEFLIAKYLGGAG